MRRDNIEYLAGEIHELTRMLGLSDKEVNEKLACIREEIGHGKTLKEFQCLKDELYDEWEEAYKERSYHSREQAGGRFRPKYYKCQVPKPF